MKKILSAVILAVAGCATMAGWNVNEKYRGPKTPVTDTSWHSDILPGYEARYVNQGMAFDGPCRSTIIRRLAQRKSKKAYLYVHGFNDYFFQGEMGRILNDSGYNFYAVDLRRYGRSREPWQYPFNVRKQTEYFADIDSALSQIRRDGNTDITLSGHSTGGLTVLYLAAMKGKDCGVDRVVTDSPFLEWNFSPFMRNAGAPLIQFLSNFAKNAKIKQGHCDGYAYSLLKEYHGEWEYDTDWKMIYSPPVTFSWVGAINHAQSELMKKRGNITVPILVMHSSRKIDGCNWEPKFQTGDAVLDPSMLQARGERLGAEGKRMVCTIDSGLHDLILSREDVRKTAYDTIFSFMRRYSEPTPGGKRAIVSVEKTTAECAEGTLPTLPGLVRVTYADGSREWRQVRWDNDDAAFESDHLDKGKYPAGATYTVAGNITGETCAPDGYPVTANIRVTESLPIPEEPVADTFPLDKVTLSGDNRLTRNRDLAISEILSWDITGQLYNYRDCYGLPTEGYTRSDGWDSPDVKLKGHGSGHYMSALAFAFASAQNSADRDTLRQRMKRMTDELRECQERTFSYDRRLGRYREARDLAPGDGVRDIKGTWKDFENYKKDYGNYGYGYLNAIPPQHALMVEAYRPYNNSEWVWAPYYSIHKQLAGFIDIATYVDDAEIAAKALLIAKDMGLWVWNRLHHRTFFDNSGDTESRRVRPGNRAEMWNIYIAGEDGGMSESLSRLSRMTDDPEESARLLEASTYFDNPAFFNPLARNADAIRGRHANQHIPKIIGAINIYTSGHNPYYYNVADNFWHMVRDRYSYSTGGVGNGEMFRQPYSQTLSMAMNVTSDEQGALVASPHLNETCCAYNLAKLTKDLNRYRPDRAEYMDYYERLLYNQIVGSLNPDHYATTYHYALGPAADKQWGNATPQESCCGGTGSESHVKYQESIYFANDTTLWVGLYIPSRLDWERKGVTVEQECRWPAESSKIRISEGEAAFAMHLRVPYYMNEGVSVKLNGRNLDISTEPGEYAVIPFREWKAGDEVEISLPYSAYIHYSPDKLELTAGKNGIPENRTPEWAGTLMAGPLAMTAGDIAGWDDAALNAGCLRDDIRIIRKQNSHEGDDGTLIACEAEGREFLPDYIRHEHSTHYMRIVDDTDGAQSAYDETVCRANLLRHLDTAAERIGAQRAAGASGAALPWARHGFARMESAAEQGMLIKDSEDVAAIYGAAVSLKGMLNAMRPGNLAEPEDLQPLLDAMDSVRDLPEMTSAQSAAVRNANTVVRYVGDGSGTHDMIEAAIKRIDDVFKGI